ncbi:MAG: hypothetical protein P1U46_02065 [Patescibacteria group bacterium]|nr:hypothetical protein [Patescibacteria group bacterium]
MLYCHFEEKISSSEVDSLSKVEKPSFSIIFLYNSSFFESSIFLLSYISLNL